MNGRHDTPNGAVTAARQLAGQVHDPALLRTVLGSFATGVTVVTVGGHTPHGMTANSFTSVSLDPPLILVCVQRDALMHDALLASGSFAISVLAEDQESVARHFASRWRPRGLAQFDTVDWFPGAQTSAPLIGGSLAWLECGLWRAYDGGDHSIFIGWLMRVDHRDSGGALLFVGGEFRQLTRGAP